MAPPAKKCTANPGLAEALGRPENKVCADCGARGASWASVNMGIFLCMECSAFHRKIGVHISVVKSSSLDTWQPKWIESCSKVGNRIANDYYEHRLPSNFPRPGKPGGTSLSMEEWIRAKYERLDYAPTNRGRLCPAPSELVKDGRDPDIYCRHEDGAHSSPRDGDSAERPSSAGSGDSRPSKEVEQPSIPKETKPQSTLLSKEDDAMLQLLTEYYARIREAKPRDQLLLIVERYRGREDTLYAQLEKKYNQPVRTAPAAASIASSAPTGNIPEPSAVGNATVASTGLLIPDVFKVEAEVMQHQKSSQDKQIDCLQDTLSALYHQSAQAAPAPPVLAANGANYSDLMSMQPTMDAQQALQMQQQQQQQQQQAAMQMQQQAAMQMQQQAAMQQMQQLAAMQHMACMPQMAGAPAMPCMMQGYTNQ